MSCTDLSDGRMSCTKLFIHQDVTIAYCPQTPWILDDTVKNNIVLDRPFDSAKYAEVPEAAKFTEDLKCITNVWPKAMRLCWGNEVYC